MATASSPLLPAIDGAQAFAAQHDVERVVDSYSDVVSDPLADRPGLVGVAREWLLAQYVFPRGDGCKIPRAVYELLDSGELGTLRQVEVVMDMPAPADGDPRWSLQLAGGALMDLGCYALHAHRMLAPWAGGQPRLVAAQGGERAGHPGVDEWFAASLEFPNGVTGKAGCNMAAARRQMSCRIVGDRGEATAADFVGPHRDDRVTITTSDGTRDEQLGRRSSYTYQLEALRAHLCEDAPLPIDADDAVATAQLIDDCYLAAGFTPRPRSQTVLSMPPSTKYVEPTE
jgi:predicted dehydrogenase